MAAKVVTARNLRLSLLDFADEDILTLARQADDLGFSRIWLAEHQGSESFYADALLMTMAVGAVTRRARVGPGGVLLRFRSPLAVANSARLLDSIYPGRMDLGLAAGSASDPERLALLDGRQDYSSREDHYRKVSATLDHLRNLTAARAVPPAEEAPICWYLDSGGRSAEFAGRSGAGYALSLFHSENAPNPASIDEYRRAFVPVPELPRPAVVVAVALQCGAIGVLSKSRPAIHNRVSGSVSECADTIRSIAIRYCVDEVMVLDLSADAGARCDVLAALSAEMELLSPEAFALASPEEVVAAPGSLVWRTECEAASALGRIELENAGSPSTSVRGAVLPNGWLADVTPQPVDGMGAHRLLATARTLLM
jgi:hypothetical protein